VIIVGGGGGENYQLGINMYILLLQSRTEEEEAKIRELEKSLKREKDKNEKIETELITYKVYLEKC
jgi:hypothetical protein